MTQQNVMFVLSGNCRTFIDCFDSIYDKLISKLCQENCNIYIYLYLKLTDPGPKGQGGWDFYYNDIDPNVLLDKINKTAEKYTSLKIAYKLLVSNEISDSDLMAQVKDTQLYTGLFGRYNVLLRGLHCHYNLECCGKFILETEQNLQFKFDYLIYVRPDLFFEDFSDKIEMYSKSIITLGKGPNECNYDHLAIIPRKHFESFFFERMNLFRNNTSVEFNCPENVYLHTIEYEIKPTGKYYIKR